MILLVYAPCILVVLGFIYGRWFAGREFEPVLAGQRLGLSEKQVYAAHDLSAYAFFNLPSAQGSGVAGATYWQRVTLARAMWRVYRRQQRGPKAAQQMAFRVRMQIATKQDVVEDALQSGKI